MHGYRAHSCSTVAAAISYHVLFSIFPLAVLLVSVLGLVLQDDHLRQETTDALVDVDLTTMRGRLLWLFPPKIAKAAENG